MDKVYKQEERKIEKNDVKSDKNEDNIIDSIWDTLKERVPGLYAEIEEEARWATLERYRKAPYTSDEVLKIKAKEKIRGIIRNDTKMIEKILKDKRLQYSQKNIEKLLKILFYLRFDDTLPKKFYRNNDYSSDNDSKNLYKSISSQIKKGRLSYDYEQFFLCINNVAKKQGYYVKNVINEELLKNDLYVFFDRIETVEDRVVKFFCYEISNVEKGIHLINDWYDILQYGCKVIWNIEKNSLYSLMCSCSRFSVIIESIRKVFRTIYLVSWDNGVEIDFTPFYTKVLSKLKKMSNRKYDIIQNYSLHIMMISLRYEQEVWIKILAFLESQIVNEEYKELNEKYKVMWVRYLDEKELKLKFCEGKRVEPQRFSDEVEDCKTIVRWYRNERLESICTDVIEMKAVYRECFVHKKIPNYINEKDMKSFITDIKERRINSSANMSEAELFLIEKIRRGVYRESDNLSKYMAYNRFERNFHEFEKNIFDEDNMQGEYLSHWADTLVNELSNFFNQEL